jgi:hypothetical protein
MISAGGPVSTSLPNRDGVPPVLAVGPVVAARTQIKGRVADE